MKDLNISKLNNSHFGKTTLNRKRVTAGSLINCRLVFVVGQNGIGKGGSLKILFRAISDMGNPQFTDNSKPNFVKISSDNNKVEFVPENSTTGMHSKLHERPWWNGFLVNIVKAQMNPTDKIIIDFKRWQVQTFCEPKFELKIFIDPFGVGKFLEIVNSPTIEIIPSKPEKLVVLAPTLVESNKLFNALIKIEDKWGNPCKKINGVFIFKTTNDKGKKTVRFQNGRKLLKLNIKITKTEYITAVWKKLKTISNPIVVKEKVNLKHVWADLHGQSEETVGIKSNSINDFFHFARDYGFLDVVAHQGNDFQISDKYWKKMNNLSKILTKDNKFIVIPGYEWSGNTSCGGDRNIYFLNDNENIIRSSHALIKNNINKKTLASTADELFDKLHTKDVLITAHSGGRPANLFFHDNKLERLVEIHSVWGNSEWLFNEALVKGYKVGVIAGSDGHTGRPGAEYPTRRFFINQGGLTCILAEKLTRKDVFNALTARHCYATTGVRIFLDIKLTDSTNRRWIMGDEIKVKTNTPMDLIINAVGTSVLETIELFDGLSTIKTWNIKKNKNIVNDVQIKKNISNFSNGSHQLFVKVKQIDGHMAWSSPIFINIF